MRYRLIRPYYEVICLIIRTVKECLFLGDFKTPGVLSINSMLAKEGVINHILHPEIFIFIGTLLLSHSISLVEANTAY